MYCLNCVIFILLFSINLSYCLNIDDFGAKSNDSSYETAVINGNAIYKAIYAANKGQDRVVLIQNGKTYTMVPQDIIDGVKNVTIQVDGRINAWNGDESKWPKTRKGIAISLISLQNTYNLVIRGNGILDGFGFSWWVNVILHGHDNRPSMINLFEGVNTIIDGISVFNSPQFHLVLDNQLNCVVQNVLIHVNITDDEDSFLKWLPTFPLNTDGIDISGKDIYFRNLTIQNFDDAVAVKPIYTGASSFTNCTENILIEDSFVKYGVGMSIGSVPPNINVKCVQNVTFRNIQFEKPLKAIYIKPNPGSKGFGIIKDIVYENITIHNTLWWAVFIGPQQQHQPHEEGTPCSFLYPLPGTKCETNPLVTIDRVVLRNVNIYGGILSPGLIVCNSTNPCTNFLFDNVNVYDRSYFPVKRGFYCENASGTAKNSNLYPGCLTEAD